MNAPPILLIPQLVLMACGCAFLLAAPFAGKGRFWGLLCLLALAAATWCLSQAPPPLPQALADKPPVAPAPKTLADKPPAERAMESSVLPDLFARAVEWCCLAFGFLFTMTAFENQRTSETSAAFFGLLLLTLSGLMLTGLANDLVVLFLGLQLTAIPLALLLFLSAEDSAGRETAEKFFLIGLLSSMLLLTGFALLYGLAGSTNLAEIQSVLSKSYVPQNPTAAVGSGSQLGVAGMVLIFAALAVWISAVPFQFGGPEILQKTSPVAAGLVATVPKAAGFLVLIRVCLFSMSGFEETGLAIAVVLSAATMVLASAMALSRSDLRQTLAYVATAHGGFVLMGLAVGFWNSPRSAPGVQAPGLLNGIAAGLFHLAVLSLSLIAIFSVLVYLRRPGRRTEYVEDLKGLIRTEPLAAVCLLVAFLSLAGIPPLPGFWSRLFLVVSSLSVQREVAGSIVPAPHAAFVLLSVLALISTFLLAAVHLRLIAVIFLEGRVGGSQPTGGAPALIAATVATLLLLAVSLAPGNLLELIERVTSQ